MADRLTQLQEAVTQMSEYFCNSIGILQQSPTPQNTENKEGVLNNTTENNTALFASLITRTAMDIETLIDSLPNQEYTPKKQEEILQKLEIENKQSGERLRHVVNEAESLLNQVRHINKSITNCQYKLSNNNNS